MQRIAKLVTLVLALNLGGTLLFGQVPAPHITITQADMEKTGTSIPSSSIGEPVSSVILYPVRWVDSTGATPAHGIVEGSIMPVDPNGWPINFRVLLPASWTLRGMQQGGGGNNGMLLVGTGMNTNAILSKGIAIYGSDGGHQVSGAGPRGGVPIKPLATGPTTGDEWSMNDEAMRNLAYMQMKKTHDAAIVIIERIYGKRPAYNYYVGNSQGGREALTVVQRYPGDYDGVISSVPIVNFSTLMLAPELIRIQEKPITNWVTPSKIKTITAEFLRQADLLDGISDGIINNYMAARAIFNIKDGIGPKDPWAALRSPKGVDINPGDTSANAKLTDGQIKTLELVYSPYHFKTPLANRVKSFGMWLPNIVPSDFGMITATRYKGQEGAAEGAPLHTHLGVVGVTGFLMRDLKANPLDYVEGGPLNKRREEISKWLDATNPDISAFNKRGGKIIITIGTMDNLASDGAQLDYYQSLINKMGQKKIDEFARLFVVPQGGHGLSGRSYNVNGEGKPVDLKNISAPNQNDNIDILISWVEKKQAPAKTLVVDEKGRIGNDRNVKGYLLCSYPNYPRYVKGPADMVSSYRSAAPDMRALK